jgi:hypothetical protein
MDNGPAFAGFLIAATLVWAAFYVGTWFSSAVAFSDAHTLDAARGVRPIVCSFKTDELNGNMVGTISVRSGLMHFEIADVTDRAKQWAIEVDMNRDARVMTQAGLGADFQPLDSYPALRVQVLEDLKKIVRSTNLHCAPWWAGKSFEFAISKTVAN